MGSWYKTCGLTKLPIYPGEKVKVIILQKNNNINPSYSTALYTPVLGAFDDIYDDYGAGSEADQCPIYQLHQKHIIAALQEKEVGDNKYHDIAVKKEGFTSETFYDAVHESRLHVKFGHGIYNNTSSLDFVMIKASAFDFIVQNYEPEVYTEANGFEKPGVERYYRDVDTFCELLRVSIPNALIDIPPNMDLQKYSIILRQLTNPLTLAEDAAPLVERLFASEWSSTASTLSRPSTNMRNFIMDAYQLDSGIDIQASLDRLDASLPLIKQYLRACVGTRLIMMFYEETRQLWAPGFHEGSQAAELENYGLLVQCITNETINLKNETE